MWKLHIWDLQGGQFDLQVEETATVETVSSLVAERYRCPSSNVILLCGGRALVDSSATLQQAGVLNTDYLHLIIKQESAPPPVQRAQSIPFPGNPAPANPAQAIVRAQSGPVPGDPKPAATKPAQFIPAAAPAGQARPMPGGQWGSPAGESPGFGKRPVHREAVAQLTELGFSESDAMTALEEAEGDVELAASFLADPESRDRRADAEKYIKDLRELMQTDPAAFDAVMQKPEMKQLDARIPGGLRSLLLSRGSLHDRAAPTGPLTAQDLQNIQQLEDLGFPKDKAQTAYLACGRNVDLAAEELLRS